VLKDVALDGGEISLMPQTEALIGRYLALNDEPATSAFISMSSESSAKGPWAPSSVHFYHCDNPGVFISKRRSSPTKKKSCRRPIRLRP
jgi:hypothetical protein